MFQHGESTIRLCSVLRGPFLPSHFNAVPYNPLCNTMLRRALDVCACDPAARLAAFNLVAELMAGVKCSCGV